MLTPDFPNILVLSGVDLTKFHFALKKLVQSELCVFLVFDLSSVIEAVLEVGFAKRVNRLEPKGTA